MQASFPPSSYLQRTKRSACIRTLEVTLAKMYYISVYLLPSTDHPLCEIVGTPLLTLANWDNGRGEFLQASGSCSSILVGHAPANDPWDSSLVVVLVAELGEADGCGSIWVREVNLFVQLQQAHVVVVSAKDQLNILTLYRPGFIYLKVTYAYLAVKRGWLMISTTLYRCVFSSLSVFCLSCQPAPRMEPFCLKLTLEEASLVEKQTKDVWIYLYITLEQHPSIPPSRSCQGTLHGTKHQSRWAVPSRKRNNGPP